MPALVTRISTGPSSARTVANAVVDRRAVGDVDRDRDRARRRRRAARRPRPRPPAPLRSRTATRWPSAANCRADAEPDARGTAGDDGDAAHRAPPTGVNSRCSVGQAAQDPRRLVVEAAVAGRPVVLLGEPDVAHAVEDALEARRGPRPGRAGRRGTSGYRARTRCAPGRWHGRCGTRAGTRSAGGRGWRRRSAASPGCRRRCRRRRCVVVAAGEAEVGLHRALDAQRLLDEVRDAVPVLARSSSCSSGCSARCLSAAASRRAVVSWPAAKRNVAVRTTVVTSGVGPVGVGGQREVGEHVLARLAPPVLDVLGELLVEPAQRVELAVAGVAGRRPRPRVAADRSPRGSAGGRPRARRAGRRRRAWRTAARTR